MHNLAIGLQIFPCAVTREDRFAHVEGMTPLHDAAAPAAARSLNALSTDWTFHGAPMTSPLPSLTRTRSGRTVVDAVGGFVPSAAPAGRRISGVKSLVNHVMTSPGDGDVQQRITPAITRAAHGGRHRGAVTR